MRKERPRAKAGGQGCAPVQRVRRKRTRRVRDGRSGRLRFPGGRGNGSHGMRVPPGTSCRSRTAIDQDTAECRDTCETRRRALSAAMRLSPCRTPSGRGGKALSVNLSDGQIAQLRGNFGRCAFHGGGQLFKQFKAEAMRRAGYADGRHSSAAMIENGCSHAPDIPPY